jgi:hypothetical protein
MTDWIDFAVYATFFFALYFAQPTMQQRLIVPLLVDRNAQWVAAHPDIVRQIAGSRWRLWLSYALGTASLGLLASYQLNLWSVPVSSAGVSPPKWAVLWELAMAALIAAMIIDGTVGLWAHLAIKRRIPLASRRHAVLERRSLDTWVPRGVQFGTYAAVTVNLAAWTGAGMLGKHSSSLFWSRFAILIVLSVVFHLGTRAMVVRRSNVMDRILGPANRAWEVRLTFSTQILPPIIGALRLYEEVTATQLLDLSRAMQIALAGFLGFWLLSMSRLPIDNAVRRSCNTLARHGRVAEVGSNLMPLLAQRESPMSMKSFGTSAIAVVCLMIASTQARAGALPARVAKAAKASVADGIYQTLVFGVVDGNQSAVVTFGALRHRTPHLKPRHPIMIGGSHSSSPPEGAAHYRIFPPKLAALHRPVADISLRCDEGGWQPQRASKGVRHWETA